MEETTEIEFQVDEQYENEKGVFTVIAKQKDEMLIRWENGEEVRTDIELQRRIQERRLREEVLRAEEAEAAAQPARKAAATQPFAGLAPSDFKNSGTGTRWRSRGQLGGAVTAHMNATGFKFNSWAFGNKAEMHVQDAAHRRRKTPEEQARFFVKLDPRALFFGFSVAPAAGDGDAGSDWAAVSTWLAQPENDAMLCSLVAEDKLYVACPNHPSGAILRASKDGWYRNDDAKTAVESLAAHIREASKPTPCKLQIAAAIPKDEAVDQGIAVAATIGQLFTRLLPLYRAATAR